MTRIPTFLRRVRADETGSYVIEFAVVMPVFLILTMGALDLGHTLYTRAVLQGTVQKAARDASLESGSDAAQQTTIDENLRAAVQLIQPGAQVDVTRRMFKDFTSAKTKWETYTDTNKNNQCDNGEPYADTNNSGSYDQDFGVNGQGSAKDVTIYTVTMTYTRMFPTQMFGIDPNATQTASTVLANQPYADQNAPTIRNCT